MPALKVFRTAIGFHDAYVAAPSRAAALRAWGADSDLFAAGLAELVSDEGLSEAPLAAPGTVIKVSRGSATEHLDELDRTGPKKAKKKVAAKSISVPVPRPPRDKLDQAEADLDVAERGHRKSLDRIDREMAKLRAERDALEAGFASQREKLESAVAEAEGQYEAALAKWRAAG